MYSKWTVQNIMLKNIYGRMCIVIVWYWLKNWYNYLKTANFQWLISLAYCCLQINEVIWPIKLQSACMPCQSCHVFCRPPVIMTKACELSVVSAAAGGNGVLNDGQCWGQGPDRTDPSEGCSCPTPGPERTRKLPILSHPPAHTTIWPVHHSPTTSIQTGVEYSINSYIKLIAMLMPLLTPFTVTHSDWELSALTVHQREENK